MMACIAAGALRAAAYGNHLGSQSTTQVREPRFEPTDFSAGHWYKGNTHTHTSETDGDSSPEVVAGWDKSQADTFLVYSVHEILLDLSRVAHLEDSTFRFVPGEEITGKFGTRPVHLIGINISRAL